MCRWWQKQRKRGGTHVPHGSASIDLCSARLVDRERASGLGWASFISRPGLTVAASYSFRLALLGRRAGVHRKLAHRDAREEGPAGARHAAQAAPAPGRRRRRHQNVARLPAPVCHACVCPPLHSARIV